LHFFSDFSNKFVESTVSLSQLINFYTKILLVTGLIFQLPLLQLFLGASGVVSSEKMSSNWRIVVVISTIGAAFLTPTTDPVTQILTSVPLISLYFLGIILTKYYESKISIVS